MSALIASMQIPSTPTVEMEVGNIRIIDQTVKQQFEKNAIRRLVRKLDWRLIPFMFLLEMASYVNRVSIGKYSAFYTSISDSNLLGHATLMGINSDLNLSESESNWSVSIFFLALVRKIHY